MEFTLTNSQSRVIELLQNNNYKAYVVGGAVRDYFLGKKQKDIDLATQCLPDDISNLLTEEFTVIPDTVAFYHGIVRIVDKDTGEIIDIATCRKDVSCNGRHAEVVFTQHISEDLARRDLTINAMAAEIDPNGQCKELIDPFNGQDDIKHRRIIFAGDPDTRIKEDHLRMIRACRFTALGDKWTITQEEYIKQNANKILTVSKERIRDEILKALSYDRPSNFFRALDATNLLIHVFPDLTLGIGCTQNEYHAEPVFDHLLRCLDASVNLTNNNLLRLATLCHDIAKPHTRSVDSDGRVHFYKHEVVGATVVYQWMRDLRFPKKDIEYVTKLVRHHQWRFEDNSKDKTIRKWLQAVGKDVWRDLITLRCADRKGNLKKAHLPMITKKMQELVDRAESILEAGNPIFKDDLAINGHHLKELGITPGKIYQDIFTACLALVINEPNKNNKDDLEAFVRKNYVESINAAN